MYTALVLSSKGGVGKTTVALALANGLAERNRRAIVIELDVMGSGIRAMIGVQRPAETCPVSLNDILLSHGKDAGQWQRCRVKPHGEFHGNVSILPSWLGRDGWLPGPLAGPELEISEQNKKLNLLSAVWYDPRAVIGSLTALLRALRDSKQFDVAVLDCPPGLGFMTHIALFSTQVEDKDGKDHSVLFWVMAPEPASFVATYTDVHVANTQFPGALQRSHFVLNKVPRARPVTLRRERLFKFLEGYFERSGIEYRLNSSDLGELFRADRFHYADLIPDAAHSIIDIREVDHAARQSHDPQLRAADIRNVVPTTVLDRLNEVLFDEEAS